MKALKLLLGIFALAAIAIACDDDEEDYVIPAMSVDKTTLSFDETGGASLAQTVYVTSNRDWEATCDADWVFFSPTSARASDNSVEVSVYVDANTGIDRSAKLTFDGSTVSVTVTVSQTGPSGESYGAGTADNPYTVADALSLINAGTYTSKNVYVKGFISKIDEIDTSSYGNATYYISDDGTTDEQLEVYRGYSLGGAKFTSSDEIQVGDEIIVYGELTMYGTTPEVTQGSKIYYLNGVTADVGDVGDHELEGDGTVDNPYTSTDAVWLATDGSYTSSNVYVKGIISQIDEIDTGSYGNATYYISDDGTTTNHFEIYRGYSLGGARFTSSDEIKVGDEVIVYGVITMFYSTPEMTQGSSIYYLNGVTAEVGGGDDDYDGEYVYHNNFDKSAATQTYGSGSSWPYLDQFDGWNNAEGSGISTVSYNYNNVSARNNSNSNGSYSNYSGSGTNNIFFGSTTNYFVIQDITLPSGTTDYTLSFGSEKYLSGGSSTFSHTEFHVYLSNDGEKWAELSYEFPSGDPDATWDRASTTFTLPSGTTSLYIYYTADVASAYRIDDVGLYASETSGTSIDFSSGVELPGGGEGDGGSGDTGDLTGSGTLDDPYTASDALSIIANDSSYDQYVYITGTVSRVASLNSSYHQLSYYISNDGTTTNELYVYCGFGINGEEIYSANYLSAGDVVVIYGELKAYNGSAEVNMKSEIISINGDTSSPDIDVDPGETVDATAAEVNAGTDGTTYRVAGYITSVASTTYGNFYLKDYTGQTYIYGTLDADGNTKNWESLGISAGDIVTVHGPKSTYNGTAELVDVTVEEHYAVTDVTIAEFNAASVSTDVYYRLTGTVTSIASTTYGNLYLEDETASVYVYGLPCGYGGSDNTFSNTGVAQGDVITIVGTRGEYGSTIEVVNGFYVETVSSSSGGGDTGDLPTFTSNVSWKEGLGDKSYDETAVINGTSYSVLKLGTSSVVGNATFTIPAGSTSLAFYCFGWNGKTNVPYTVTIGNDSHSLTAQGNSGFNNNSPYTVTVSDANDYQTITFDSALTSETTVKVETTSSSNPRVVFAGINYYTD